MPSENIKNWDATWDRFKKTKEYRWTLSINIFGAYMKWMKKNYNAPIKKAKH